MPIRRNNCLGSRFDQAALNAEAESWKLNAER
jgi:hypothetical protein